MQWFSWRYYFFWLIACDPYCCYGYESVVLNRQSCCDCGCDCCHFIKISQGQPTRSTGSYRTRLCGFRCGDWFSIVHCTGLTIYQCILLNRFCGIIAFKYRNFCCDSRWRKTQSYFLGFFIIGKYIGTPLYLFASYAKL